MIEHLKIGQIVNTQGLKGEVRVYPLTDDIKRYDELNNFFVGEDFNKKYNPERVRYKGNLVILKIDRINSIEDAEKLKGKYLYVSREDSRKLEEGEFFISDMIGIEVYTVNDEYVGVLKDVLQYAANDVYVVKNEENKEFLIPAVMKFVPTIDIENRKMIIDPIKGMID